MKTKQINFWKGSLAMMNRLKNDSSVIHIGIVRRRSCKAPVVTVQRPKQRSGT